ARMLGCGPEELGGGLLDLSGDLNGDYYPWWPAPGIYTIEAIPSNDGEATDGLTITITVDAD
ncbi:MAG: hypothetical protein ACOCXR_00175, partial [Phototrophicaceae bacterium]